jgi:hypothetical protein
MSSYKALTYWIKASLGDSSCYSQIQEHFSTQHEIEISDSIMDSIVGPSAQIALLTNGLEQRLVDDGKFSETPIDSVTFAAT